MNISGYSSSQYQQRASRSRFGFQKQVLPRFLDRNQVPLMLRDLQGTQAKPIPDSQMPAFKNPITSLLYLLDRGECYGRPLLDKSKFLVDKFPLNQHIEALELLLDNDYVAQKPLMKKKRQVGYQLVLTDKGKQYTQGCKGVYERNNQIPLFLYNWNQSLLVQAIQEKDDMKMLDAVSAMSGEIMGRPLFMEHEMYRTAAKRLRFFAKKLKTSQEAEIQVPLACRGAVGLVIKKIGQYLQIRPYQSFMHKANRTLAWEDALRKWQEHDYTYEPIQVEFPPAENEAQPVVGKT